MAPFDTSLDSKVTDFSLGAGEKIHINLKGGTSIAQQGKEEEEAEQSDPIALLPPPPANARSRVKENPAAAAETGFEDDFGDFQ